MPKKTLGQQLVETHEEHQKNFQAEAGELVNSFGPSYMDNVKKAIQDHLYLERKFYVQVISKHLPYAPSRGMHLTFFVRLSEPALEHTQDLWSYDPTTGALELEWSLPHKLEMKNFLRDQYKYSPKLIQDIKTYLKQSGTHLE